MVLEIGFGEKKMFIAYGLGMEVQLSYHLVLLSVDSKTM